MATTIAATTSVTIHSTNSGKSPNGTTDSASTAVCGTSYMASYSDSSSYANRQPTAPTGHHLHHHHHASHHLAPSGGTSYGNDDDQHYSSYPVSHPSQQGTSNGPVSDMVSAANSAYNHATVKPPLPLPASASSPSVSYPLHTQQSQHHHRLHRQQQQQQQSQANGNRSNCQPLPGVSTSASNKMDRASAISHKMISPGSTAATSASASGSGTKPSSTISRDCQNLRNQAEKNRRDRFNRLISDLSNNVPFVTASKKRQDKTSVLRLAAAYLRLINYLPNTVETKLPQSIMNKFFDMLEFMPGFVLVTNCDGKILYVSPKIEKYLGHQDNEVIGHSLNHFLHPNDAENVRTLINASIEQVLKGSLRSDSTTFHCRLKEKNQPRSDSISYRAVRVSGHVSCDIDEMNQVTDCFGQSPHNEMSQSPATANPSSASHSPSSPYQQSRHSYPNQHHSQYNHSSHYKNSFSNSSSSFYSRNSALGVGGASKTSLKAPPSGLSSSMRSEKSSYQFNSISTISHRPFSATNLTSNMIFLCFVEAIPVNRVTELKLADANFDEYISRHSLDGTLLYADQRIAQVIGFFPTEVKGKSAYEFIVPEDFSIAIFAHKLMLSNSNGTGVVVHRLKAIDGSAVFLQTAGFLQYNTAGQIDHFICVSRMLVESEGDKERDKFVQRFTPHIYNQSPSELYDSLQLVINPHATSISALGSLGTPMNHSASEAQMNRLIPARYVRMLREQEKKSNSLTPAISSPSTSTLSTFHHQHKTNSTITPVSGLNSSNVIELVNAMTANAIKELETRQEFLYARAQHQQHIKQPLEPTSQLSPGSVNQYRSSLKSDNIKMESDDVSLSSSSCKIIDHDEDTFEMAVNKKRPQNELQDHLEKRKKIKFSQSQSSSWASTNLGDESPGSSQEKVECKLEDGIEEAVPRSPPTPISYRNSCSQMNLSNFTNLAADVASYAACPGTSGSFSTKYQIAPGQRDYTHLLGARVLTYDNVQQAKVLSIYTPLSAICAKEREKLLTDGRTTNLDNPGDNQPSKVVSSNKTEINASKTASKHYHHHHHVHSSHTHSIHFNPNENQSSDVTAKQILFASAATPFETLGSSVTKATTDLESKSSESHSYYQYHHHYYNAEQQSFDNATITSDRSSVKRINSVNSNEDIDRANISRQHGEVELTTIGKEVDLMNNDIDPDEPVNDSAYSDRLLPFIADSPSGLFVEDDATVGQAISMDNILVTEERRRNSIDDREEEQEEEEEEDVKEVEDDVGCDGTGGGGLIDSSNELSFSFMSVLNNSPIKSTSSGSVDTNTSTRHCNTKEASHSDVNQKHSFRTKQRNSGPKDSNINSYNRGSYNQGNINSRLNSLRPTHTNNSYANANWANTQATRVDNKKMYLMDEESYNLNSFVPNQELDRLNSYENYHHEMPLSTRMTSSSSGGMVTMVGGYPSSMPCLNSFGPDGFKYQSYNSCLDLPEFETDSATLLGPDGQLGSNRYTTSSIVPNSGLNEHEDSFDFQRMAEGLYKFDIAKCSTNKLKEYKTDSESKISTITNKPNESNSGDIDYIIKDLPSSKVLSHVDDNSLYSPPVSHLELDQFMPDLEQKSNVLTTETSHRVEEPKATENKVANMACSINRTDHQSVSLGKCFSNQSSSIVSSSCNMSLCDVSQQTVSGHNFQHHPHHHHQQNLASSPVSASYNVVPSIVQNAYQNRAERPSQSLRWHQTPQSAGYIESSSNRTEYCRAQGAPYLNSETEEQSFCLESYMENYVHTSSNHHQPAPPSEHRHQTATTTTNTPPPPPQKQQQQPPHHRQ